MGGTLNDLHLPAAQKVSATIVRRLKIFDGFCLIMLRKIALSERRTGVEIDGSLLPGAPPRTGSSPNDLGECAREMALISEPASGRDFRERQNRG